MMLTAVAANEGDPEILAAWREMYDYLPFEDDDDDWNLENED